MTDKKYSLPLFGIGPVYVLTIFLMTAIAVGLNYYGILKSGAIPSLRVFMVIIGTIFVAIGIVLWIYAVVVQKISKEIKKGELITTGVYAIVRNPIYSAFSLAFTGVLCMCSNIYLLVLPLVFWIYLTILLKKTEEKWLKEKFKDEYILYCKHVNRVIPNFKKYDATAHSIVLHR